MEDDYLITKNHTVEASSEEEAREKIKAHYKAKCKGFFIHKILLYLSKIIKDGYNRI